MGYGTSALLYLEVHDVYTGSKIHPWILIPGQSSKPCKTVISPVKKSNLKEKADPRFTMRKCATQTLTRPSRKGRGTHEKAILTHNPSTKRGTTTHQVHARHHIPTRTNCTVTKATKHDTRKYQETWKTVNLTDLKFKRQRFVRGCREAPPNLPTVPSPTTPVH